MQHYLTLGLGNFCAKKQHSNKVLPFGTRRSGNYDSPCIWKSEFCAHAAAARCMVSVVMNIYAEAGLTVGI